MGDEKAADTAFAVAWRKKMRSNTGRQVFLLCSTIKRWAVHQPQQALTQDCAAKCVQQTESWITFSVDTQYGAPVITVCQCVWHRRFSVFLGSHIKAVVVTVSASKACNRRKTPGVSEDPVNLPSAHGHLMICVSRCVMWRLHERAADTITADNRSVLCVSAAGDKGLLCSLWQSYGSAHR